MLDPNLVPLFYLSSLAGLVMVVGSIWLIYKQKIFVDRETKQVTEIKTPLGTLKTNLPAILLFVIGFFFMVFPIVKVSELTRDSAATVNIVGTVDSSEEPVIAYAVLAEQTMLGEKQFRLTVPIPRRGLPGYTVLVQAGPMLDKRPVSIDARDKQVTTDPFHFLKPPTAPGYVASDFLPDTVAVPAMFHQ